MVTEIIVRGCEVEDSLSGSFRFAPDSSQPAVTEFSPSHFRLSRGNRTLDRVPVCTLSSRADASASSRVLDI